MTNTGHEPKAVKIEGDNEDHDTSWLDKEFSEDDCNDRPRRGAKSKNKTSNSNKDVGSGEESNSKGSQAPRAAKAQSAKARKVQKHSSQAFGKSCIQPKRRKRKSGVPRLKFCFNNPRIRECCV